MSNLVLYSREISPPCRAVLMTAKAIGVTLKIHDVNLMNKEHLTEQFQKMNPQHTIPTLDDNGFILWDSHAIMCYLVNKYAKDDSLYPKDPQRRAVVDQRLHFDSGELFATAKSSFRTILFGAETTFGKEQIEKVGELYDFLNKFLEGKKWLAGDSYTLADISCITTVTALTVIRSTDGYPNLAAWMKNCEKHLPGYDKLNVPGNKELHTMVKSKLK